MPNNSTKLFGVFIFSWFFLLLLFAIFCTVTGIYGMFDGLELRETALKMLGFGIVFTGICLTILLRNFKEWLKKLFIAVIIVSILFIIVFPVTLFTAAIYCLFGLLTLGLPKRQDYDYDYDF